MAPSIVSNDAVQGETFLPGQIFVFGGFVLRANSLGRLEQIDSYATGHQEMDPIAATAPEPKQIVPSEATKSTALEPHTDSTSCNTCVNGTPDSFPATRSGSGAPAET